MTDRALCTNKYCPSRDKCFFHWSNWGNLTTKTQSYFDPGFDSETEKCGYFSNKNITESDEERGIL